MVGALLSAVVLAVVSPTESESGTVGRGVIITPASPPPSAAPPGPGVPTERPAITLIDSEVATTDDGVSWTRDRELALTVTVPPTQLRAKQLRLEALVDGQAVSSVERPRGETAVTGIRLADGHNTVTVRLVSDSGEGPLSDPLTVGLDSDRPHVAIRSPRDNTKVTGDTITVTGESEVGARITIVNQATRDRKSETVGPSGTFEKVLRSANGRNRIIVSARDAAGNVTREVRTVTNAGTRAVAEITVRPRRVKVTSLPTKVRVQAAIADAAGAPIRGAAVTMTLGVPGGPATQSYQQTTNREGVFVWTVDLSRPVAAGEKGTLTLVAKLPDGRTLQSSLSAPDFY